MVRVFEPVQLRSRKCSPCAIIASTDSPYFFFKRDRKIQTRQCLFQGGGIGLPMVGEPLKAAARHLPEQRFGFCTEVPWTEDRPKAPGFARGQTLFRLGPNAPSAEPVFLIKRSRDADMAKAWRASRVFEFRKAQVQVFHSSPVFSLAFFNLPEDESDTHPGAPAFLPRKELWRSACSFKSFQVLKSGLNLARAFPRAPANRSEQRQLDRWF